MLLLLLANQADPDMETKQIPKQVGQPMVLVMVVVVSELDIVVVVVVVDRGRGRSRSWM